VGFIEEFTDFILDGIRTNPDWAKTVAIVTLSPFCGGLKYRTSIGEVQPSLYALYVSPSGTNKTNPLKYRARPVVKKAQEILRESNQNERILYPDSFSIEKMTEILSGSYSGVILSNEFTKTLKASYGSGYLAQIMEFLSEMYDGTIAARGTYKSGDTQEEGCCVSFVSTTTSYIYRVFKDQLFVQGTMNRFLLLVSTDYKITRTRDEDLTISSTATRTLDERVQEFSENLAKLRNTLKDGGWEAFIEQGKASALVKYVNELEEKAEILNKANPQGLESSYYLRLRENVYKLALILCVSDNYKQILISKNNRELLISEKQQARAIELAELRSA